MLDELFCGTLEDRNVEGSAEDGGLACDISEESSKFKDSTGAFCYFELGFRGSD